MSVINDPSMSKLSDKALLKLWFARQTALLTHRYVNSRDESLTQAHEADVVDVEIEMNRRGFRA
jgi:hypothetical protein